MKANQKRQPEITTIELENRAFSGIRATIKNSAQFPFDIECSYYFGKNAWKIRIYEYDEDQKT